MDNSELISDAAALRGLAHPLRLRMLGLLRVHGPSTASRLAKGVGESSALTSYHLRGLASAGHIVDADTDDLRGIELTGGRERWWKAAAAVTRTGIPDTGDIEDMAADTDFTRAVVGWLFHNADRWVSVRGDWPQQWRATADISDAVLRLTAAEAAALQSDIATPAQSYRRQNPAGTDAPADSVVVSLQYQLFPYPEQPIPS